MKHKIMVDCVRQVVLLFVSSAFVADQQCQRMFKFARDVLQKDILVVMVGKGRDWQHSDIGMQLAEKVPQCFVAYQCYNYIFCPI